MATRDKNRRILLRVVVVFVAGLVCSVLVSRLIPQIEWVMFVPMGLAAGMIIPEIVTLMRGDE
ncbi:hypothetical protein BJG92_03561 [Arthrobacter sp. SO5]|uniref:hypothetical protein n=1 Tax=Arthrobacter sp. SO5 TaxID=1897055 RepID=UPI001E50124C|nr:hypothetical protein [Arthrobacter sp. SO5]MCB5276006.1 hypothetical protein [Arthrobacter sp. SO5]